MEWVIHYRWPRFRRTLQDADSEEGEKIVDHTKPCIKGITGEGLNDGRDDVSRDWVEVWVEDGSSGWSADAWEELECAFESVDDQDISEKRCECRAEETRPLKRPCGFRGIDVLTKFPL